MKKKIANTSAINEENKSVPRAIAMKLAPWFCLGLFALCFSNFSSAHNDKFPWPPPKSPREAEARTKAFTAINDSYLKNVKPIFAKSCFDCHSDKTVYPIWHKIPGVRQYIDRDIAHAKRHVEMSHDFPFGGHGNPPSTIDAIRDEVDEGDMPPWRYWLLHPETKLNAGQKKVVDQWAAGSLKLLGFNPNEDHKVGDDDKN